MPAVRELELQLPHQRLAARAWGDSALPPLLALHGWLDNAASFDALAPLLCEHFYIVALDLPGHGRSDWRPPGVWYHYVDYLSDVLAAASALGWKRYSLLGHSLGGTVASILAASRPAVIEHLLLIEALGPLAGDPEQALTQLQRALDQRDAFEEKSLRVFAAPSLAIAARRQANGLSEHAAEVLVTRGIKTVPGGYSWSSDPRLTLASATRYNEAQVLAMLRGVQARTLLVLAQPEQPYLPREMIERRIAAVPHVTVRRLEGSHHLHLENPQPVATAILEFVVSASAADQA
jgi:pimeloyl-ACP methyl ester carboxylesterase